MTTPVVPLKKNRAEFGTGNEARAFGVAGTSHCCSAAAEFSCGPISRCEDDKREWVCNRGYQTVGCHAHKYRHLFRVMVGSLSTAEEATWIARERGC